MRLLQGTQRSSVPLAIPVALLLVGAACPQLGAALLQYGRDGPAIPLSRRLRMSATRRFDVAPSVDEQSSPGSVGDPHNMGALTSDVCNSSAMDSQHLSAPMVVRPAKTWMDKCQTALAERRTPSWDGQNYCWQLMKVEYFYEPDTWQAVQMKLAKKALVPYPSVLRIQPLRNADLCEHRELGARITVSHHEAEAAQTWFSNNILVYVLNLPADVDRWTSISSNLQDLGIAFRRVEGIDMRKPGKYSELKSKGILPQTFDLHKAQNVADSTPDLQGILGNVGVAVAHLGAMRQAQLADSSDDRHALALILEDDVVLEEDFVPKLHRLLVEEAPCDWTAISLTSWRPFGYCISPHLTRVFPDMSVPADRCRKDTNFGFQGMLYRRSRLAALQLHLSATVWDEDRPHCLDIDVALASISDKVTYYAVPSSQSPGFLWHDSTWSSRRTYNSGSNISSW